MTLTYDNHLESLLFTAIHKFPIAGNSILTTIRALRNLKAKQNSACIAIKFMYPFSFTIRLLSTYKLEYLLQGTWRGLDWTICGTYGVTEPSRLGITFTME